MLQEELRAAEGDLALTRERLENLTLRATAAGVLVLPGGEDLRGRFVRKGQTVAYITDFENPLIRVVVPEDRSDLVRSETNDVAIRFASDKARTLSAKVEREVPALTATLPNLALATEGGGRVVLDPGARGANAQRQALSNYLHLEVRLLDAIKFRGLGERVYVRFDHGEEPVAMQIYRVARQVFLRQFDI